MRSPTLLTTTEAAQVAGVAPSTIKRWTSQGLLPFSRTAGGHRRFERFAIERLARPDAPTDSLGGVVATEWIRRLVDGQRHEIDGGLLEARSRLGSWARVADELAGALVEMGEQWAFGRLTVAEEHMASDALVRGLARVGDALPTRRGGPKCGLASAYHDDHTLGLSLAELCLREAGWTPQWLGRRTPLTEVIRLVKSGQLDMVGLSASVLVDDAKLLQGIADEAMSACEESGVGLVLGGAGAWPDRPRYGARLTAFDSFHDFLNAQMVRR